MKVAIVTLHFADRKLTNKLLESVENLVVQGFDLKVIVVNNNPREILEKEEKRFPKFYFLNPMINLGFAGGNNLGIKKALEYKADWIFLLNNDTVLDKNILSKLVEFGNQNRRIGIIGPKIYFAAGREYHYQRYQSRDRGRVIWYAGGVIDWSNVLASHRGVDEVDGGQYDQISETDFASGCAMMISSQVLKKIGLLEEKYFLYLEDLEFCCRAKKAGFKIYYLPDAKLWHFNAGSSKVGGLLHDYFLTRNRLLFGLHYAPIRSKIALIKESLKLLSDGREWQKIGVKDFYLGKFGKGSWNES